MEVSMGNPHEKLRFQWEIPMKNCGFNGKSLRFQMGNPHEKLRFQWEITMKNGRFNGKSP